MSLIAGTRLGSYEILAPLGAGGMGEVYRARDRQLDREVALKVLPDGFADDPDRRARFEREARTLAALNHPHIAALYGVEHADGIVALAMELVDGPTLAARIARGPIPVPEALDIARQIADAVEAAHERGIVHRDLKPANIMLTSQGQVKVLDFGLAKALDPSASSDGSRLATITSPAMTHAGVILGSAAYMSPEQARGGAIDKRADIWAFGAVVFEMLTGRRLFDEPTVSETAAAVLKGEIELDALPGATPPAVRGVIARCLTRDWRRRLRDIGEARIAIDDALAHPETAVASPAGPRSDASLWRRAVPWAIAAGALVATGLTLWPSPNAPPGAVIRLTTDFAANLDAFVDDNAGDHLALSPDGRLLLITGIVRRGERSRLYVRRLDQLDATAMPDTEGARNPFFSPDGRWIGFFADGKLKKVQTSGGTAVTLCDAPDDRGGSWSDDGWIAFSPRSGASPLFRVPEDGGTPEPLTSLASGEVTHRWPQVLPGGRGVLYTSSAATGNYESANLVVRSLDSGRVTIVHRGGYHARYLPTGHLIYVSQGTLFAAPFSLERLQLEAPGSPVLSDVSTNPGTAVAEFAFASTGEFAYVRDVGIANRSMSWINRDGKVQPMRDTPEPYVALRFSPSGTRIATSIPNRQLDVWVYDWAQDLLSVVAPHPLLDSTPVWTPDGQRLTFRSARNGVDNIYWQRADGSGEAKRLTEHAVPQWPRSWHPSGRFLAFDSFGRGRDIWILPMEGDEVSGWKAGKPTAFLAGPANEWEAVFSPDGQWLAYQSNESGADEVYVQPFPGPGGRRRVSTAGGRLPRWSPGGKELFFVNDAQQIMAARYSVSAGAFLTESPRLWSKLIVEDFDVHPDGQRVAALTFPESLTAQRTGSLVFTLNFFDELRRRAPIPER